MAVDKEKARTAAALALQGLRGKEIGRQLGVSTDEAHTLVAVGTRRDEIERATLTKAETLLLRLIAHCEQRLLDAGETRGPRTREIAKAAIRSTSWPAKAGHRLRVNRLGDSGGLNLIYFSGNGALWLTTIGWMVVHAIEAAEAPSR